MHKFDYSKIYEYFLDSEYDVEPCEFKGLDFLRVSFEVNGIVVSLLHRCVAEITSLPHFFLENYEKSGRLAHVLLSRDPDLKGLGSICVNNLDSVSINYECPELAFGESIRRHQDLLTKLLTDSEFNESELLREFSANWQNTWLSEQSTKVESLICACDLKDFDILEIFRPLAGANVNPLGQSYVAVSRQYLNSNISNYLSLLVRSKASEYISAFYMSVKQVSLGFPSNEIELKHWICEVFELLDSDTRSEIESILKSRRSKEFWGVFGIETPSGVSYFGIRFCCNSKKSFPDNFEKLANWSVEPISLTMLNKEELLFRGGADNTLSRKKVLLVGCGSVGSEAADKLGAAGVGFLSIVDPDYYSPSNIYRHFLDSRWLFEHKSLAVSYQLMSKYPWLEARGYGQSLLNLRDQEILREFDLVIAAIGSPTQERIFQDYVVQNNINTSVIYTWLEGYGIGGHAVLDVPGSKGCLKCAYVDPESGRRGLASNLNFLVSDQDVVKNFAGCGEMFIPYGHLSSSQTALVATDLALKYLRGKQTESAKVSWKGGDDDAIDQDLKLSGRYSSFDKNLKIQSLCHPMCDVCSDQRYVVYGNHDLKLRIPASVVEELTSYRQDGSDDVESAGLLIGYGKGSTYTLYRITSPQESDIQSRAYFKLDSAPHQKIVDEYFSSSDGLLGYIGTWHTHPQSIPSPSNLDLKDWLTHEYENQDRPLFFVIVGTDAIKVFSIVGGKAVSLRLEGEACD
ncbi:MAG: ThiF family adenylyltransferase [Oceanospirillaceae bacterium]|nr:ThiF family adenylyltransferase [Oceanospirillaceae bacterium]